MNIWKGTPVCDGIAVGTAAVYRRQSGKEGKKFAENTDSERDKYKAVKTLAIDEFDRLFKKAQAEIGGSAAQIFSIHKMMLEDMYYNESVLNIIEKQKMNAETAVLMTSRNFEKLFRDMESAYMRERADDIRDVSDRVVALLSGKRQVLPETAKGCTVLFAGSITPGEALQMDKSRIAAFVTESGSATSHTAVVARSLGIPAVAGIEISGDIDGKMVAVDGYTGTVYVEPEESVIKALKNRAEKSKRVPVAVKRGKARITAAITAPEEVKKAEVAACDGVGIYKSDGLFRDSATFPPEAYQFDAYRKVLEGAKEAAICALDIDSRKKGTFFGIFGEENAEMGLKGIRICLKYPSLFKTQLRAVLRASVCGKAKILLPMITSAEEVVRAKKILAEAKAELTAEKREFDGKIPVGAVIETPAAAIISDDLAEVCDFFLIDADKLAQFTLATDRKNIVLAEHFDCRHSAVMRLIETVAKNAKKRGIAVGIFGEIASDCDKIPELLRMGITEFAVSPKKIYDTEQAVWGKERH